MMISSAELDQRDSSSSTQLQFLLRGTECAFANALRRSMIADVNTVAFQEPNRRPFLSLFLEDELKRDQTLIYDPGFIEVLQNTSEMHTEILVKRIAMIPLYIDPLEFLKSPSRFTFTLDVHNDGGSKEIREVTPADFLLEKFECEEDEESDRKNEEKQDDRDDGNNVLEEEGEEVHSRNPLQRKMSTELLERIFPGFKHELSKELLQELRDSGIDTDSLRTQQIPIVRLHPGQSLRLRLRPTVSCANSHAAFSPVSKCFYFNDVDQSQVELQRSKIRADLNLSEEDRKSALLQLEIHDKYRFFKKNRREEACDFHFFVKSLGPLSPHRIFNEALTSIVRRVEFLDQRVSDDMISVEVDDEYVYCDLLVPELFQSRNEQTKHRRVFCNNGHTIGNLLQSFFYESQVDPVEDLLFIGYRKTYPFDPLGELESSLDRKTFFPHSLDPFLELSFIWKKSTFKGSVDLRPDTLLTVKIVAKIKEHLSEVLRACAIFSEKMKVFLGDENQSSSASLHERYSKSNN